MPIFQFGAKAVLCCLPVAAVTGFATASEAVEEWHFSVLLDGKPIGTHQFALTRGEEGVRTLRSDARFDVKILGLTAYRYRHHAEERWDGDCLVSIASRTDDDGSKTAVTSEASPGGLRVTAVGGKQPSAAAIEGCVMSFAYWNPQLAKQNRLLDPGTGRLESVTISSLPARSIEAQGKPVAVTGVRIAGLERPIDIWYAGENWVGLDTEVRGGRKLTYRQP
jgi:hypothetical protein